MKLAGIAVLLLLVSASVTAQDYPKAGGAYRSNLQSVVLKKKQLAFADWATLDNHLKNEMSDADRLRFYQDAIDNRKAFFVSAGSRAELIEQRKAGNLQGYYLRFSSGSHKNGTAWVTNAEGGIEFGK